MDRLLAGRYRLLDRLGAGGMSEVWRAHDDVLDRPVAIKVLDVQDPAATDLTRRIRAEARSAARLRHPHVVEVHDFGETEDGVPFVVMELLDGRSVAELARGGALPWRTAVRICAQVAGALAAAHAAGVVHRDVKPSNVMVTEDGAKLVDFGISATVGEADGVGGEVFGTPAYLAPERLRAGVVASPTDVYALGLLLYLTLAGRLPWSASTTTQMLTAHRYLEPDALPPVAGLPFEVADLCRRCTAKDPADRPTAEQAARILADAAGLTAPTPMLAALEAPTESVAAPAMPFHHRHRRSLVAATVLLLALTVAGIAWSGGRTGGTEATAMNGAPAAAAPPATQCAVGYAIRDAADGKLATAVTVSNTGTAATGAWELAFTLADDQRLVRGWTDGWSQNGHAMTVAGTSLPAGGKLDTGFDSSYTETTTLPARFTLNGTVCESRLTVAGQSVSPAERATTERVTTGRTTTEAATKPQPKAPAPKPPAPKAKKATSGKGSTKVKANSGKGSSDDDDDDDDDDD